MSSEAPKKRGRKLGSTNKPTGPVGSRASSVRRNVTLDDYPAIQVEGGLFTVEHVRKVAKTEADKQTPTDYELPAGIELKEEIGRSFRIATALWKDFDSARQGPGDKTQATERFVCQLLKDCFGFADIRTTEPKIIAEMPYPIGRTAHGKAVPVVIVGAHQGLDVADLALGDGHRKRTASQLTQEYLNAEDACLWAVCTNGLVIRLLRDSDSLTRQSYFEANIERVLGEQLMADFAMLWLHAHASRFKPDATGPAGCPLEIWHLAAQEEGSRVRDSLRIGVEKAMVELGSGFLEHRDGARLREALRAGTLKLEEYHQQVLRLVYRMLFLFAVEDRKLLHPRTAKIEQIELYAEGYSLSRLRERSIKHCHDRYDDIWDSLKVIFRGLATGQEALGLPPLGSLFAEEQCAELVKNNISNRRLLNAIRAIAWFRENDALVPVNYKSMGTEELGSVYESLLELTPAIDESGKGFGFIKADEEEGKGNSRKTSGSYYTPDSLVQQLLDTTLDPVVADRLKGKSTKEEKEKAILSITVIDPACGSGHFLLGAARRLAEKLASIRAEGGESTDYRRALRDVIASCIHGVDRNPMAIQLAKVALWLEGYVADKPLSFLDHHLVVGDSILSVIDLDMATKGIPDEAYEVITGDDKAAARVLKAKNKTARDSELKLKQGTMDLFGGTKVDMGKSFAKIDVLSDDTLDGVAKKVGQLEIFMKEAQADWRVAASKLYLGAYLLPKADSVRVPTSLDILAVMNGEGSREVMPAVDAACHAARVLLWPLAFPHVFQKGGFDIVLGNPPWERLTLKEKEYFAQKLPSISKLRNKNERQKAIDSLRDSAPGTHEYALYQEFLKAKRVSEVSASYAHNLVRYPLTGQGDVNLYALFAETFLGIVNDRGQCGFIAPTGIATDKGTATYFSQLITSSKLVTLFDFENRKPLFKGVDRTIKFSLVTVGKSSRPLAAFKLKDVTDLKDARRHVEIGASTLTLLNPNTKNAPIVRSSKDMELLKRIYERLPVFSRNSDSDGCSKNAWPIGFKTMFHMSGDSNLFLDRPAPGSVPLYESKMVHIYDHRWNQFSDVNGESTEDEADSDQTVGVSQDDKQNPDFFVSPRYWVPADIAQSRMANLPDELIRLYLLGDDRLDEFLFAYIFSAATHLSDGTGRKEFAPWASGMLPDEVLLAQVEKFNPPPESIARFLPGIKSADSARAAFKLLLRAASPCWLLGWRAISKPANARTLIPCIYPFAGTGHSIVNITGSLSADLACILYSQLASLVMDYVVRSKIGGTNLSLNYFNQFPTARPESLTRSDYDFIVPRVLELIYTSNDMKGFYDEVTACDPSYDLRAVAVRGKPYEFNQSRRVQLKAELDAYWAFVWGLGRDDLRFILDPQEVMGADYPSETFRGLRDAEIKEFGEYRTQRLVLESWDRIIMPLCGRRT